MTGSLLAAIALLAANAFFVGAEFALVSARRTRMSELAATGNRRARQAAAAMADLTLMLSATQLGITVASLGLGALAEPAIEDALHDLLVLAGVPDTVLSVVAFSLALLIVVTAHMVLGEMVPKNLAISAPESAALWLGPPLYVLTRLLRPVVWLLNTLANAVVRLVRVEPVSETKDLYEREDLAAMARQAHERGLLDATERALSERVLALAEQRAGQMMTAWADVPSVPRSITPAELERRIADSAHTRFRVGDADGDYYVPARALLLVEPAERHRPLPRRALLPLPSVAADAPLADVLGLIRNRGVQMAAVREGARAVGVISIDDIVRTLIA